MHRLPRRAGGEPARTRSSRRKPARSVVALRYPLAGARRPLAARRSLVTPNHEPKTVQDFGREWTTFDQAELSATEAREHFERYFRIFPWGSLPNDAVGFDAGCGSGRWARFVAERVGTLYCFDASAAAAGVARRNLSTRCPARPPRGARFWPVLRPVSAFGCAENNFSVPFTRACSRSVQACRSMGREAFRDLSRHAGRGRRGPPAGPRP